MHCGESGRLATNGYDPLVQMINVVNAIDWKSRPAQALGVLVTGSALGLVWILSDLTFSAGIMGWIVFAIVGLPVYVTLEKSYGIRPFLWKLESEFRRKLLLGNVLGMLWSCI